MRNVHLYIYLLAFTVLDNLHQHLSYMAVIITHLERKLEGMACTVTYDKTQQIAPLVG